jgi:hypothetical protein
LFAGYKISENLIDRCENILRSLKAHYPTTSALHVSTVISILSISPSYQPNDLKAKLSKFPQFHATKLAFMSGHQMEQIKHSVPDAAHVSNFFTEVRFLFLCDVVLLESIRAYRPWDPVMAEFVILAALPTCIAFIFGYY